jgi:hypothetical protein
MGTRNPNTRRVLPDIKAGMLMGKNLYPLGRRVRVGLELPIPVYPWVKYTRINTTITI